MLVPLSRMNDLSPTRINPAEYVAYSVLCGLMFETSLEPGATMSGFCNPSYHVGPRELYHATVSSAREIVCSVSTAPTVIADGAFPGEVMPAYAGSRVSVSPPKLPAEATTTMPAAEARSTACTSGSVAAGS